MSAAAVGSGVSHATLDLDGRVVGADAAIGVLNEHAGGGTGRPIAVPALADVARLARQLGIAVSRRVVVADEDADLDLWVRAQPEGGRIRLTISGWRELRTVEPSDGADAAELDHVGADLTWELDAALRITFIDLDAARVFGVDGTAVLGRPLTALFTLEEGDDGTMPMLEAIARRVPFGDQRARLRGQADRQFRLAAATRTDADGAFAGFVGTATLDVPPIAEAEPPLSGLATSSLDRMLKQPLETIIATADAIGDGGYGPLQREYGDYASDIASAGRHLIGLVDDLAEVQAIEDDDFAPAMEPIDIAALARRAAGLLSVRASEERVAIARPLPDASIPAVGDERHTLQILVNLIGNAIRYSPADAVVTVSVAREEGRSVAVVDDQGQGIAPVDQERIFAKFERLDPGEGSGSGLGLYIARRLARAMGGDLTVESVPGEGARFVLALPAETPRHQDDA